MRVTFSTHEFARAVLADTAAPSCNTLRDIVAPEGKRPGSKAYFYLSHVANWVHQQYPDSDTTGVHRLNGRVVTFDLHSTHRELRRKEMAERLLSCPDRQASITLIKDL